MKDFSKGFTKSTSFTCSVTAYVSNVTLKNDLFKGFIKDTPVTGTVTSKRQVTSGQ